MSKSVLVLGAGIAGLRAASVLNERGYKVTVIERSPMAGGCTSSWIDHRDSEKRSMRKGQMQMIFPFYENLFYFCWKDLVGCYDGNQKPTLWMRQTIPGISPALDGFYFVDEHGKRTHLSGAPRGVVSSLLNKLPAPLSALQILKDFDGFPSLWDKTSTLRFHMLALLFGGAVTPPISDDFNFYGLCRQMGLTHNAIKAFRRITYSITNLSDADQVGPKFMHLFYLAYLRDKNILGCRMFSDDCNPAFIDPLVAVLKKRGVKFRFNCHTRDIFVSKNNCKCDGVRVYDFSECLQVVCINCGLKFPVNCRPFSCPMCGHKDTWYHDLPYRFKNEIINTDFVVSALQPHQLASIFSDKSEHPLRLFPEFRALGQFKGAALTVSRIFLDSKVTSEYNLTGLDRDYYSMNGAMDIGSVMPRYSETSVFDTLSDDGEVFACYPEATLKSCLVSDLQKVFPETREAKVRGHLMAHIAPEVLYHRTFPRLNSRFLPNSPLTPLDNFFLAGDWMDEYQIGMEAAVKSGVRAANFVLNTDNRLNEAEPIFSPSVAPLTKWLQENFVSRFIRRRFEQKYKRESPPRRG